MTDDMLRKQLEGVTPPDSPTDDMLDPDYEDEHDESIDSDEDLDAASSEEGDSDEPKQKRDRPDENYFREMIRKSEEREERMLMLMERLAESRRESAEPVKQSGNGLDDRSVEELRGLRGQVPEEKLAEFDAYLNHRIVQEEVEKRLSDFERRNEARTARQRYGQEAVNRYPELADSTSSFAKKVDAKLKQLGKKYIDANPRAIVDVANEVAISTGHAWRGDTRPSRRPKSTRSTKSAPVKDKKDSGDGFMSKERAEEIAKRLSRGLPAGKKFDTEKIRQRANEYDKNRDLFIK